MAVFVFVFKAQHLCLEYMQPWLPNVRNFVGVGEKMGAIIRGLVTTTIEEKALYPALQAKVWFTIASVDDLVKPVVEEFLKVGTCSCCFASRI